MGLPCLMNINNYSEWAKDFERKVVFDACFAFPDYNECKASKKGKKRKQ